MKKVVFVLAVLLLTFLYAGLAFSGNADTERDLAKSLRRSQKVIEKAQRKLSEGQPIKVEITQLQQEAEGIRASNLLLEERFRVRGQNARELGGKARQRQEEMEVRYHEVLGQLQPLLDELARGGAISASTIDSLQELFKQIVPEKKNPILGSLPYSHLNYPVRAPVAAPPVVPAYRGGNSGVTAADTRETADALITPEIAELAKSLDWNPVRIYEWVQENIETEWYWGSMKGADETLRQRSGNDADQAALLIAMLRSAGFPTRYVRGVIEFFPGIEQAKRLTGLDDPLKIAAFFQKAGIPFEPMIAGGKIANFRVEHVWVETQVPYSNYRGALLDNMGKTWIALDTHMKPPGYQWNNPEDFGADFNLAALRDHYLFQPRTETPLEYLRDAFDQHLGGEFADTTFQDHLRIRTLVAEPLGILPASLQFRPTAITGEYTELPGDLRHQVTFTAATTDGNELFTITFDAAILSNRSASLSYEPETVEDQQIIHSYGGLDNTPSYLVHLRPVLRIDGERKVVGQDGLPMGADYILTIELASPNGRHEVASHHVIGNLSSLGIVSQKVVQPMDLPLEEKDAERLLYEAALSYVERWNAAEEELAAFFKVAIARPLPTVVTVGGVIDVAYLFDVPQGFDWKGVFIDAGFRRIETVASPAQEERAREFIRLSALEGSILENRIFEDDFGVASISTAKLLALAPQPLTFDGSNADALLPTLDLGENVEADILNAVHQGLSVTLPEAELGYKNWTGIGYIKENPATGEAGYMLSGMIAGGMTAEEWADQMLRDRFENAYSEPPNQDPGAAARMIMIPVGDRQNGTVGQEVEEPLAVLVVDLEGRPVAGAEVTFTALGGGAQFDGAATAQVTTGGNGIAKVRPTLGTRTKDNPSYLRTNQGDAYVTQVGVNLFSATVSGQYGTLSLPKPFEVYAQPDVPVSMVKVVGDGNGGMANNPAGTLKVLVVDQYQNPVSNVPVTYQAESAVSMDSWTNLPQNYRSVTFYDHNECTNEYPLYGECSSSTSISRMTAHFGVGVNAILGNTVNTRYEVSANTPGVPGETFTLYSGGYWGEGDYLPPQLFVRHLTRINDQGEEVNAAKAGEQLRAPLVATMFLMTSDYTMEGPTSCTKYDSKGQPYQTDCWTIKGSGLVHTERINDGTVLFTPVSGGGSVASTGNLGDGAYQTTYTTGSIPSLNRIEAIGQATVTIPQVYGSLYGGSIEEGYTVKDLPLRTITLESGQKGLFNRTTKELLSQSSQKIDYEAYGVEVTTEVSPKVVFLGEGNMARDDLTVTYSILPDGDPPAGYGAVSAEVDLSSVGLSGGGQWEGYLIGSAVKGTGTAVFSFGTEFDPQKNYYVQSVLNRGGGIEIRGEKIPLKIVTVDLDIDSDNNAGFKSGGTHNDPQRGLIEDQVEDYAGAPGKLIRPNLLDVDRDKVPGFADGINKYGNEGEGASAPFVPLVIELGGTALDPATATVRFDYPGSDPVQVQQQIAADGAVGYTPAPGSLRLWTRDGGKSRNVANLAAGGDYVKPNEPYRLSQLGTSLPDGNWRLYVEAVRSGASVGSERIALHIDPDGAGPLPEMEGDAVRTTPLLAALVPDYNHDRVIDEKDIERAERGDTYYFWINDDDDSGETGGDDIPGEHSFGGELDCRNYKVDGVRDLIDFFPVALDIKSLVELFPANVYSYRLKSADENLNVVFPDLSVATVENYLTDVDTARRLAEAPTKQLRASGEFLATLGEVLSGRTQTKLDELIGAAATQDTSPVILLEGVKPSTAPLVLEIKDQTGNQVFTTSLKLSLDGVEQMFRHKNLIGVLSSQKSDYQLKGHDPVPSDKGMPDRLTKNGFDNPERFAGFDADNDGNNFIHVHGYNINDQGARGEQSEAFKRLYWSGSKARFWGITWYSWESQWPLLERTPNYHVNVRHAFNSGRLLKEFVNQNVAGDVTVFAHSLGNMMVSAAIEEGMSVANYLMVNAAVAEEAFTPQEAYDGGTGYESNTPWRSATKEQMYHPAWRYPDAVGVDFDQGYQPQLWASEWYKLFAPDDGRSTLTWRNRFAKVRDLIDIDTFVYYSPTDEAFRPFLYTVEMAANNASYQPNTLDWPGVEELFQNAFSLGNPLGAYAFALQELLKGRMLPLPLVGDKDSDTGGWGFNLQDGYQFFDVHVPSAVANSYSSAQLKTKPFFLKNTDFNFLYTDQPAVVSAPLREELLANEIPALTFAAGHRGVEELSGTLGRNIDIRLTFAVDKPWPQDRLNGYEWKHSDIYVVAYPYLSGLYDEWAKRIKGE